MIHTRTRNLERPAFGALVSLLLAPVIAQGLWLPLVHLLGAHGSAVTITWAALGTAAIVALAQAVLVDLRPRFLHAFGGAIAAGASAGLALGAPGGLTLLTVAVATGFLMRHLPPRLPSVLDGLAARNRSLTAVYAVVALATVIATARVSTFMGDASRGDLSAIPSHAFARTHSCLSAYVRAADLCRMRVDNLYETQWWLGSHGLPPRPAGAANPYAPFDLDAYLYPPPFLLVMTPLATLAGDFPAQRALWFGLNGLLLALGLWIVARWLDGPGAHRALLLAPIFFGSLPILATLQVGQFQIAVVVMAILAMVAFHSERPALGGALLSLVVLSKISPVVLCVVLLVQRRWRAVAWTAAFGVCFFALSALTSGIRPIEMFFRYALPRLTSGEAFATLNDSLFSVMSNVSPFGLPFKLQHLGFPVDDPWAFGLHLSRVYTLLVVLATVLVSRRLGDDRRTQAVIWMSILVIAAAQSPFAPGYITVGLLWALTLLAPEVRGPSGAIALVLLWTAVVVVPPFQSPQILAVHSILHSGLVLGVPCWLMFRRPHPCDARPGPLSEA